MMTFQDIAGLRPDVYVTTGSGIYVWSFDDADETLPEVLDSIWTTAAKGLIDFDLAVSVSRRAIVRWLFLRKVKDSLRKLPKAGEPA